MQDAYVGDIGDYGKYGLLREMNNTDLRLAVNWYKTVPRKAPKQNEGELVDYLNNPEKYKHYDPVLFESLKALVTRGERLLSRIEQSGLIKADFFSEELYNDRISWHKRAMEHTKNADIVFLDPDIGLEIKTNPASEQHVKYCELKDYYDRGQSIIVYQHNPRRDISEYAKNAAGHLHSNLPLILKYPNIFYFLFPQENHDAAIKKVYNTISDKWRGICKPVSI